MSVLSAQLCIPSSFEVVICCSKISYFSTVYSSLIVKRVVRLRPFAGKKIMDSFWNKINTDLAKKQIGKCISLKNYVLNFYHFVMPRPRMWKGYIDLPLSVCTSVCVVLLVKLFSCISQEPLMIDQRFFTWLYNHHIYSEAHSNINWVTYIVRLSDFG